MNSLLIPNKGKKGSYTVKVSNDYGHWKESLRELIEGLLKPVKKRVKKGDKMLKILVLDNCHECIHIGTNGVTKSKYCCVTGNCVDGFDSDFLPISTFPTDCPLKTFNPPVPITRDDYV